MWGWKSTLTKQLYQSLAHALYAWGVGVQQAMGETGKRDSKVRNEGPKQQVFSRWHQLGTCLCCILEIAWTDLTLSTRGQGSVWRTVCLENCIQTEIEVTSGLRVCVLQRWKDQESGQYGEGTAPNLIPLGASIDLLPHQWMNAQSTPEKLQMSCLLTCRT